MEKFTVIGYYQDNGERYATTVEAENGDNAELIAKQAKEKEGLEIAVCGVIQGEHKCVDTSENV